MTRIALTLIFTTFFISGCEPDLSEDFQSTRDRINAELDTKYDNRVSALNEEARSLLPANSIEKLVQAFEMAFNAGDFEAVEQMAHFDNLVEDAEKKEKQRETLLTSYLSYREADGESHIETSVVRDLESDDTRDFWNLKPVMIYEYDSEDNDGFSSSSRTVPIVEVDSQFFFYLCTVPPGYFDEVE